MGQKTEHMLDYIQPGKPMQNGYIERLTDPTEGSFGQIPIQNIGEVKNLTANWIVEYNEIRPHESLANLVPKQFL